LGEIKRRECLGYTQDNPNFSKSIVGPPGKRMCSSCHEYGQAIRESSGHEPPRKAKFHSSDDSPQDFEFRGSIEVREPQLRGL
jgi:hypothetical protein